jgi:hypothetical protein
MWAQPLFYKGFPLFPFSQAGIFSQNEICINQENPVCGNGAEL